MKRILAAAAAAITLTGCSLTPSWVNADFPAKYYPQCEKLLAIRDHVSMKVARESVTSGVVKCTFSGTDNSQTIVVPSP